MQSRDIVFEVLTYNPTNDPDLGDTTDELSIMLDIHGNTVGYDLWALRRMLYPVEYAKDSEGARRWWRTVPTKSYSKD